MTDSLTPEVARLVIDAVGSSGVPPEYGYQFFTVGLDDYLDVMESEYLSSLIKSGGSSFKMVLGGYGSGKTHFLYSIRDLAWKHNFVVSYVVLTPEETPFHKLELVYKAIVGGLMHPMSAEEMLSGAEKGIGSFIKYWYSSVERDYVSKGFEGSELTEAIEAYTKDNIKGFESISFTRAVRQAFLSLHKGAENDFENILMWLEGEGYIRQTHVQYGILQRIDKSTAFSMIRSLAQWLRSIGYSGLVILFDEAERVPSFSTKQIELLLNNLRQLIDECHHTNFQGFMIFYAVPDESFLERRGVVYAALKQRLATVFDTPNPTGAKINLEKIVGDSPEQATQFLENVGLKLATIYERAYNMRFEEKILERSVVNMAAKAYEQRFGDVGYKRLFVQKIIEAFHYMRQHPSSEIGVEKAEAIVRG